MITNINEFKDIENIVCKCCINENFSLGNEGVIISVNENNKDIINNILYESIYMFEYNFNDKTFFVESEISEIDENINHLNKLLFGLEYNITKQI